jgi:hypothetical protein
VYGADPPTLEQLLGGRQPADVALAVFAVEYRPGARTPHREHADLCCSRTGVSRVGTADASYDAATRQHDPLDPGDPYAFRVLPVRYAPFFAIRVRGASERARSAAGDDELQFWVPIHKLFSGSECIAGMTLSVSLTSQHVNETPP